MYISWRMDKQNVVQPYSRIYSTTKRNEVLIRATKWVNLENIMLSEKSQNAKDISVNSI